MHSDYLPCIVLHFPVEAHTVPLMVVDTGTTVSVVPRATSYLHIGCQNFRTAFRYRAVESSETTSYDLCAHVFFFRRKCGHTCFVCSCLLETWLCFFLDRKADAFLRVAQVTGHILRFFDRREVGNEL